MEKYNEGNFDQPIATICHNDDNASDPTARRVKIWVEDSLIVAQATDEVTEHNTGGYRAYNHETALETIEALWGGPVWDLEYCD